MLSHYLNGARCMNFVITFSFWIIQRNVRIAIGHVQSIHWQLMIWTCMLWVWTCPTDDCWRSTSYSSDEQIITYHHHRHHFRLINTLRTTYNDKVDVPRYNWRDDDADRLRGTTRLGDVERQQGDQRRLHGYAPTHSRLIALSPVYTGDYIFIFSGSVY